MSDALYRVLKRVADVGVSAVALVVVSPVILVIAIAIKAHDSGSVFFRQDRAGKDGHPFRVIKFRTMASSGSKAHAMDISSWVAGVPDDFVFKTPDSGISHVTPVGRFLRRSSLDELPQLLNVLRGDMSLVGPRPEIMPIVERYSPEQARRLSVKPGITGWAQVTGRSLHNHGQKVRADLYYVDNASLSFDLKVLARTLWVALRGQDAF